MTKNETNENEMDLKWKKFEIRANKLKENILNQAETAT